MLSTQTNNAPLSPASSFDDPRQQQETAMTTLALHGDKATATIVDDDYVDRDERRAAHLPTSTRRQTRLRCLAQYTSLGPQAMACSGPVVVTATAATATHKTTSILSSTYISSEASGDDDRDDDKQGAAASSSSSMLAASLGAVAGNRGVAVFSAHQPHRPGLVLSLVAASSSTLSSSTTTSTRGAGGTDGFTGSSNNSSNRNSKVVSSLAFQPVNEQQGATTGPTSAASQSLYLAAARGDGVLVWDVSGHSLSPLWGRWSARPNGAAEAAASLSTSSTKYGGEAWEGAAPLSSTSAATIVDLCWHTATPGTPGGGGGGRGASSERYDCLLAVTSTHACMFDVRVPPSSSSSSSAASSTALRFAYGASMATSSSSSSSLDGPRSPLVSVASQGHMCAVMNRAGFLHVYDARMAAAANGGPAKIATSATTGGAVAVVPAFHHAGVGLASYSGSGNASRYGGWVTWGFDATSADAAAVKVWSIGDNISSTSVASTGSGQETVAREDPGYRLVGSCSVPNLCCARVGPEPFRDSIVTVAMENNTEDASYKSWTAQLWKIGGDGSDGIGGTTPQMEAVATFRASSESAEQPTLVDGTAMGRLCASELAAVVAVRSSRAGEAAARAPHRSDDDDDDDDGDESDLASQSVLLLCSLTDKGYMTTHEIPEASPSSMFGSSRSDSGRSRRAMPSVDVARQGLRVFPADKDAPLGDAAGAWAGGPVRGNSSEKSSSALQPWLQQQEGGATANGPAADIGGGVVPLPFDMDFAALAVVATADGDQVPGAAPLVASVSADASQTAMDAREAINLMQRIETDRIPCPRLCGATFGPGIGRLVTFNNGDVRRMWSWWERTYPTRSASSTVPGIDGELLLSDDPPGSTSRKVGKRGCPRTLKDLMDMTVAAKEAQWGDQDESDTSSTGFHAPGPSFFEDGSVGSTDSGEGDEDAVDDKDMYDSYFGESQRPLLEGGAPNREEPETPLMSDRKPSEPDGPSSDTLAPFVHLTRQFEKKALSSQRIELAKAWKLGPMVHWESVQDHACAATKARGSSNDENAAATSSSSTRVRPTASAGLPPYRFLVPPSQSPDRFNRASSDPQLQQRAPNMISNEDDDERGVHGGDYGVRPNMQESMVFLRKLFTHQQDGGSNFPALYSPPDGPMLPNSRSDPAVPAMLAPAVTTTLPLTHIHEPKRVGTKRDNSRVGLYTLQASDQEQGNLPRSRWMDVQRACLHNARVCGLLGEDGKRSVWELLAKAVAIRSNDEGKANSFGPYAGGGFALGRKLVSNILQYYEVQGDVQMLATIVCVLQAGMVVHASERGTLTSAARLRQQWSLLPQGQSEKFDVYIRRYGDLLFAWGLLTTRAELNKHLASTTLDFDAEYASAKGLGSSLSVVPSFVCPRCTRETAGSSFCNTCNMFAFRCVICDNSVRGLFSSCPSCGHGGHTAHMQQWFASHDECPTGCGCVCWMVGGRSARATRAMAQPLPEESPTPGDDGPFVVGGPGVQSRSLEVFAS